MNAAHTACASSGKATAWDQIDWPQCARHVRRLQARIVKATQAGRWNKVKALQRLLTCSFSGKALAVKRVTENKGKRTSGVDGATLSRLTVCHPREMALASGDRLQLKANGKTARGHRLVNGELVTVDRVLANGQIRLRDGRTLGKDYRRFVRGFAITSYASQGKTVDYVLFADSAVTAATNQQQWYVTISRGRKGIRIFTSDKVQLRENITRPGGRDLAMDLADREFVGRLGIPWRLVRSCPRPRVLAVAMSQRIRNFIAARRPHSIQQSQSIGASP